MGCSGDCGHCALKADCPARRASAGSPVLSGCAGALTSSRTDRGFGFAADIGSTTLAFSVYDLETGEELAARGARNPQVDTAADVIGRISRSESEEGLVSLNRLVTDALRALAADTCKDAGFATGDLSDGVVTGNTAMLHILTGRSPAALARHPFKAGWLAGCRENVCGLDAWLVPAVGAFTGGDLTAAMIAASFDDPGPVALLLDVGTNAEIALRAGERVYVASAAAGPAFEGAGGGIGGSGLIAGVARFVRGGRISPSGAVTGAPLCLEGGNVLTQDGVSSVQMAKAAVAAGISVLMDTAGVSPDLVEETVLAGGFGSALDVADAVAIGMMPYMPRAKPMSIGNAALTGAAVMLLHPAKREAAVALASRAVAVELSGSASFAAEFMNSIAFPAEERAFRGGEQDAG